jgi:hypothetical protein
MDAEYIIITIDSADPLNVPLAGLISAVESKNYFLNQCAPILFEMFETVNAFDHSNNRVDAYIEFNLTPPQLKEYAKLFREYYGKNIDSITDIGVRSQVVVAREHKTRNKIKRILVEVKKLLRGLFGDDISKEPVVKPPATSKASKATKASKASNSTGDDNTTNDGTFFAEEEMSLSASTVAPDGRVVKRRICEDAKFIDDDDAEECDGDASYEDDDLDSYSPPGEHHCVC